MMLEPIELRLARMRRRAEPVVARTLGCNMLSADRKKLTLQPRADPSVGLV